MDDEGGGTFSSTNVIARSEDIRRQSLVQVRRLENLRQRLITIQIGEAADYVEHQLEYVTNAIAESRGIRFPETEAPDFLRKGKKVSPQVEDEKGNKSSESKEPPPSSIGRKEWLEDLSDANHMMKSNVREIMLASQPLGKEDYDTESDSDFEDEVEAVASFKSTRPNPKLHGYLPIAANPATSWSRMRHALLTRWVYLVDAVRNLDYRLRQQDALITHIKATKPQFKFEEKLEARKPVIVNPPANLKDVTVHYFGSTGRLMKPSGSGVGKMQNESNGPKSGTVAQKKRTSKLPGSLRDMPGIVEKIGGGLESLQLKLKLEEAGDRDPLSTSRRVMPVKAFRQRKVFQLGGIHNVIGKSVKKPTVLCPCFGRTELCAVCSGRSDKVKPIKNGAMTNHEILALLDHTYHKTLSAAEEKPVRRLVESALRTEEWKKSNSKKQDDDDSDSGEESESSEEINGKSYSCLLETVSTRRSQPLKPRPRRRYQRRRKLEDKLQVPESANPKKPPRKRRRIDSDMDEDELEEDEPDWIGPKRSKPSSHDAFKRRRLDGKYDIDHIVIPYSIAAATRVEKIEYKEILIPRWRINKVLPMKRPPPKEFSPRLTRRRRASAAAAPEEDFFEDVSPEAIKARHLRSEADEKKRFLAAVNKLSKKRARRSESKADNQDSASGPESNDPLPALAHIKVEEVSTPASSNQISAADASLAVTALKVTSSSRRRTISNKPEDEDDDEPAYIPFEPRTFPLDEEEYARMEKEMEEAYMESELIAASCGEDLPKIKGEPIDDEGSEHSNSDDPDWRDNIKLEQPSCNNAPVSKSGRRSGRSGGSSADGKAI